MSPETGLHRRATVTIMPGHDIVVIGGSAGGVEALMKLVSALPADFSAAMFVVLHFPPEASSALPQILTRCGPLPAMHATERMPIEPGRIFVAPPDLHLLIEPGHVHLVHGPKENGFRPAIDPLFRSAARAYGRRVVGVTLSGLLDDGTAGLLAIKRRGGLAVVQHPKDALFNGMPKNAIQYVEVDHVLPVAEIPSLLTGLAALPISKEEDEAMTDEDTKLAVEHGIDAMDQKALEAADKLGKPAPFSCPDCGGVLSEFYDGPLLRFRCQVGHAYSPESVLAGHSESLDHALWHSFNMLDERVTLMKRLAEDAAARNDSAGARRFQAQIDEIEDQKSLLLDVMSKCSTRKPPESDRIDADKEKQG